MWTFYNSSGEAMIIDGGVQNPMDANLDISTLLLVGNGGTTGIAISADGEVTMAAQPAFSAYNSARDDNVTGAGTLATADLDTEIFDQGGNFASDTFTAPVTGQYQISAGAFIEGSTTASTDFNLSLVASNRTWLFRAHGLPDGLGGNMGILASALIDMDADDTLTLGVKVSGESSDVVDIAGAANPRTFMSGYLVA